MGHKGNKNAVGHIGIANNKFHQLYTEEEIEELCKDIVHWADTARDIHIMGWAMKHKKTSPWINWLCDHYPKFAAAKAEAMKALGRKMLNLSFYDKSVNAYVGMKYLYVYDDEYKKTAEWEANLKNLKNDLETAKNAFELFNERYLKKDSSEVKPE